MPSPNFCAIFKDFIMADDKQTVSIDGKEYPLEQLSEKARQQLANLRGCDEEISRLQRQSAIAQAARVTYSNMLQAELPAQEPAAKKPAAKSGAAKNGAAKKPAASRSKKTAE